MSAQLQVPESGSQRFVRAMGISDLDAVMAAEVQAYPFPWTRGNFVDSLAAGYFMCCLWDDSRQLLGYLVAMHSLDEWHLLNITVAPARQGRGHARALLRHLITHAVNTGAQSLWLEVRPSNERARRLYVGFDFVAVGLRRGYYPAEGGQREDALVMRRAIGVEDKRIGHALD